MAKGIIVLEEIPRSCIECPMCYHATDMSIGKFQYERLYRCGLEPEDAEQVYLEDICHEKPDWCPIKPVPERANHENYCDNGRYDKGWNDCLNEVLGIDK